MTEKNTIIYQELKRFFGDIPVIDLEADVQFRVTNEDIRLGEPGDARNCALSLSCERSTGSPALFWPSVTYFQSEDNEGNPVIKRGVIPSKSNTRKLLNAFDIKKNIPVPGLYIVKAPSHSQKMNVKVTKQRTRAAELKLGAIKDPKRSLAGKKAAETRKRNHLMGLRNGSGMVQTKVIS